MFKTNLSDARDLYIEEVRQLATNSRARTSTPGKTETYAAKLAQAEAYLSGHQPGGYVEAEAARNDVPLEVAARAIVEASKRASSRLEEIDKIELDTIQAIKSSESMGQAYSLLAAARGLLKQFA